MRAMKTLALALAAAAALSVPAAPATASCTDLYLPSCLDTLVNWDRLDDLCRPPRVDDPLGC